MWILDAKKDWGMELDDISLNHSNYMFKKDWVWPMDKSTCKQSGLCSTVWKRNSTVPSRSPTYPLAPLKT